VRGTVSGFATSTCHRCLKTLRAVPSRQQFELTLDAAPPVTGKRLVGVAGERSRVTISRRTLREAVLLEEPIRTLCADDCKGLCPQCGADLNSGPCGCDRPADPRWPHVSTDCAGSF
jgi:uncharacterized protein